jgi:hypothetical protein
MLHNIRNYRVLGLCLPSGINTTFGKLVVRMEIDPVSETLCLLVFFRIQDDGQSPEAQKFWPLYHITGRCSNCVPPYRIEFRYGVLSANSRWCVPVLMIMMGMEPQEGNDNKYDTHEHVQLLFIYKGM